LGEGPKVAKMLRLRKSKLLPQQVSDLGAFIFVVAMIPVTYLWEVLVVSQALFPEQEQALVWAAHMLFGLLVVVNIAGNFAGLWLVDTSTTHIVIPSSQLGSERWHYCAACEAVSPPRAWHCSVCGVCVLKREHHCMFAGYCVGHFNHRYFLLFLAWLWLGVLYCTYLNSLYVWAEFENVSLAAMVKFVFPLLILMSGMDLSWTQVAIFFWSVHVAALLLTTVLLVYHVRLVQLGSTTFEANRRISAYNLGWRQNWREVLGARWYLAIFNPFVKSRLPHDGVQWDTQGSWKLEAPKNR